MEQVRRVKSITKDPTAIEEIRILAIFFFLCCVLWFKEFSSYFLFFIPLLYIGYITGN
jgi:hypothetical protein